MIKMYKLYFHTFEIEIVEVEKVTRTKVKIGGRYECKKWDYFMYFSDIKDAIQYLLGYSEGRAEKLNMDIQALMTARDELLKKASDYKKHLKIFQYEDKETGRVEYLTLEEALNDNKN